MGLEDVRARLKDRQVKDGALGTTDTTVCLDLTLIEELEELQTQLAATRITVEPAGKARLGGTAAAKQEGDSTVADLEAKLAAKEQEVRDASLRLVFRSVGSSRYQELLNSTPDTESNEGRSDFFNELASACLAEVWQGKDRITGLEWDEIYPVLSFGEWDDTTAKVYALNRRKVDVPFSLRP
ncbi:hypothetical protein GCM10009616_35730 [Microlunatus lacustris]